MARSLRIRSITPGKMVGGRFIPNPKQTMKLGKGGRFKKLEAEIAARGGAYDPQAVAAAIGMRKYGKKRMEKWARSAKRRNPRGWSTIYSVGSRDFTTRAAAIKKAKEYANDEGAPITVTVFMNRIKPSSFGYSVADHRESSFQVKPSRVATSHNPGDKEINVLVPHRGHIGGFYAYRTVARTIKEAKREAAQAAGYSRVPKGTKAHVIRTYNPKRKRKPNRRRK